MPKSEVKRLPVDGDIATDPDPADPRSCRRGITINLSGSLWEPALYALLFFTALAMRLWDLGARAYHHDESLHAYYSWNLFQGTGFQHNPLLHGPFLFDLSALGFFLFGDNLVAPRVFPALFGAALVLMPLLLRHRLGVAGALAAAAMLAFSPSMFYFSRFIRNDIFSLVFDFGLIIAMWRYVETKKHRYLYIGAVLLALSFSSKETAFITLAIVGSFLLMWWSQSWLRLYRSRAKPARKRPLWFKAPPHAGFFLLVATLSLPLLSAAIGFAVEKIPGLNLSLVNEASNWTQGPVGAPLSSVANYTAAGLIGGILFIASAAVGLLWRRSIWLIAFGAFYAIFFFLHTTFLTEMTGLGSGVWQSLGYWIAQQSVERGSQPWYYYFMLLPLYEFLPFAVGVIGLGAVLKRLDKKFLVLVGVTLAAASLLAAAAYLGFGTKVLYAPIALGVAAATWIGLRSGGDKFDWFLVYWVGMSLVLYIVAGEKMPWLVTHLALPFIILAGRFIGQLITCIHWSADLRNGGIVLLLFVPVLLLAIRALVLSADWDRLPLGVWSFTGAMSFTVLALAAGMGLWLKMGGKRVIRLLTVSAIVVLGVFTVRAGMQAAYENGDVPVEMLVYTQTSPDIPMVFSEIERIGVETGKHEEVSVLIDTADGFGWPWFWYLRGYTKVSYQDMSNHDGPIGTDVVVLNRRNQQRIAPSSDEYTDGRTIPFRQWFPEDYRGYTAETFFRDVISRDSWSRMLNFFTYRTLGKELGHIDSVVYYSKDVVSS